MVEIQEHPPLCAIIYFYESEICFKVKREQCEMMLLTSIGPVELVGHPVNRQTCWALQTGVHHHLEKQGQQRFNINSTTLLLHFPISPSRWQYCIILYPAAALA